MKKKRVRERKINLRNEGGKTRKERKIQSNLNNKAKKQCFILVDIFNFNTHTHREAHIKIGMLLFWSLCSVICKFSEV